MLPLWVSLPIVLQAAAAHRITIAMQSGADSVATRTTSEGTLVLLSGQPLFVVTAADVDTAIGESMGTRAAASSITIGYDVPWRRVHELMIAGRR